MTPVPVPVRVASGPAGAPAVALPSSGFGPSPAFDALRLDEAGTRARLEALARLMDSAIRVPGTNVRLGLDAALNVIPGVGTLAAKAVSAYLIWEARRLGVPTPTLLKMAARVGVDAVLSSIPILGWVGDAFYRANTKNMATLRAHLDPQGGPGRAGSQGWGPARPLAEASRGDQAASASRKRSAS